MKDDTSIPTTHSDRSPNAFDSGKATTSARSRSEALMEAQHEVDELRRTQEALRASEAKYRDLFESIDEGFCVVEVLFDSDDQPLDYIFLEANPAFQRQTGMADAVGKRMRDLAPAHEQHWFDIYGRIALTGEPERFEQAAEALGHYYDVYAFRIGDPAQRRVAILFSDIAERKHAEQEIARSNHLLRTTFDNSLQIIQLFKAIRDEQGAIVDFEWLLTNKQWDDRYGPNAGKRLLTENPAVVKSGIWDKFLEVIESGVPITHEHYYGHEQFDGWFLQTIAKADDGILLSTLDITDRKRAELALQASEEKYRTIFDSIDEGFALIEVILDDEGRPVDLLHLETNAAYELHAGVHDVLGKRALEITPDFDPMWFDFYGEVARTGEARRAESYLAAPVDRWITLFASRVGGEGSRKIAVIFNDITDRKRAETVLRESGERQAFLLALGDAMRSEPSADGKIVAAARLLGEKLDASRVLYAEYDHEKGLAYLFNGWLADGAQLFPSVLKLQDFKGEVLTDLLEGRVVRVDDVGELGEESGYAAIANVGVQALLSPPLLVNGKLKFNVSVHDQAPRHWRDDEVALVQEVSERLWAEIVRARAEEGLRNSERHAHVLLAELQHRVRNTLAVVRSIARRTADTSGSVEDMAAHVDGRLNAFARVQAAVTRSPGAGVSLESIVEDELLAVAARQSGQLRVSGPEVMLQSKPAELLSLAIHELATNAVKYGALADGGRVEVAWTVRDGDDGRALDFEWRETGVRDAKPSDRDGFGHEMLRRSLPYELDAETSIDFQKDGLRFTMTMPLRGKVVGK